MIPAANTSEDLGQSRWVALARAKLAQYLVPSIVVGWLSVTAAAVIIAPNMVMKLNVLALLVAAGAASLMFPGTVLILTILSFLLSPENFLFTTKFQAQHVPNIEIQSLQKFVLIGALGPAVLRYGIRPVMNQGIAAIIILAGLTFIAATPYPGLTPMQTLKSFVGLALPFFFFNLRLQKKWLDPHLTVIAFFPIISIAVGFLGEMAGLRDSDGHYWGMITHEFTGAIRLAGINIPAYLAFFTYISFFVCLYKAIALKQRSFYVLGGIALATIILTGTRTPSVCAIVMAGITIFFSSGRDLRGSSKFIVTVLGVSFLAAILAYYWPDLQARMASNSSEAGTAINTSGRAGMWDYLLGIWDVNQMFGRGLGTGAIALLGVVNQPTFAKAAHNEYIRLLVDGGIVGLIVYVLGVVMLLFQEGRYLTRTQGVSIVALFVSFALYSFTDNTISSPPSIVLFYAVALVMAKARFERLEQAERPAPMRARRAPMAPVDGPTGGLRDGA